MDIKKILSGHHQQTTMAAIGDLILRAFTGFTMMTAHGLGKIPPNEKFIESVTNLGFPAPLFFAWNAGLAETLGGLLLALGLLTRPASFIVFFTMIVAAFGRHADDPFKQKELALLYMVICLYFLFNGAGKYSIDKWLTKKI